MLESLAVSYWYRRDFEDFLRAALAGAPELLTPLNFDAPKRQVAGELVARLRRHEDRYQDLSIDLLLRLSQFDRRFPRLAKLEDGAAKVVAASLQQQHTAERIGEDAMTMLARSIERVCATIGCGDSCHHGEPPR